MRYLLIALRLLLAGVFLYAAYTKLRQPWLLFAMSIDAYQLLPEWAALTLGRILPWLELLLGIALAAGFGLRYAAGAASVLLAVFLAVMVRAYVMGMKIDCACFGLGEVISAGTLARDAMLLALAVTVTVFPIQNKEGRAINPAFHTEEERLLPGSQ